MEEQPPRNNILKLKTSRISHRRKPIHKRLQPDCYLCREQLMERHLPASLSRALSRRYDLSIKLFYQQLGNRAVHNDNFKLQLYKLIDQQSPKRVLSARYNRGEGKLLLSDIVKFSSSPLPRVKDGVLQLKLEQMRVRLKDRDPYYSSKQAKPYSIAKKDELLKDEFSEGFGLNQDTTSGPKDIALSYIRPIQDLAVEISTFNVLDELSELLMSTKPRRNLKVTEALIIDSDVALPKNLLKSKHLSNKPKLLIPSKSKTSYITSPSSPKSPKGDLIKDRRNMVGLQSGEKTTSSQKSRMDQLKCSLQAAAQLNTTSSKNRSPISGALLLRQTKTQGCYSPDTLKASRDLMSPLHSAKNSARPLESSKLDFLKETAIQILEKYSVESGTRGKGLQESKSNKVYTNVIQPSILLSDLNLKAVRKEHSIDSLENMCYFVESPKGSTVANKTKKKGFGSISLKQRAKLSLNKVVSVAFEQDSGSPKKSLRSSQVSRESINTKKQTKSLVDMNKLAEMKNKLKLISERRKCKVIETPRNTVKHLEKKSLEDFPTDPTNIYDRPASLWDKKASESKPKVLQKTIAANLPQETRPENLGVAVSAFWQKLEATKQRLSRRLETNQATLVNTFPKPYVMKMNTKFAQVFSKSVY